jgi:hypothetical protein
MTSNISLTREDINQIANGNQRIIKFMEYLQETADQFNTGWRNSSITGEVSESIGNIKPWVNQINILMSSLGASDASTPLVQIGDAASWYTSGYFSTAALFVNGVSPVVTDSGAGFHVQQVDPTFNSMGVMTLTRLKGSVNDRWLASHSMRGGNGRVLAGGGRITVSEPVTRVRIINTLGTPFDDGFVGFSYRR